VRTKLLFIILSTCVVASCHNNTHENDITTDTACLLEKETLIDGVRQGQYLRYFPSGQLEMSCNYKDGKLDGPVVFYHETNGHIARTANYRNGILEGDENSFYEEGILKSTLSHGKDGIITGITAYYKSGLPSLEIKWDTEHNCLVVKFFYENGTVSEIVKSRNLIPVDDYISYYDDGSVKKTGFYSNGDMAGTWRLYDRQGNIEREITY